LHCKKKVRDFPVPSRDVTNQTFLGRKYFSYSRPGGVWNRKIANLFLQCGDSALPHFRGTIFLQFSTHFRENEWRHIHFNPTSDAVGKKENCLREEGVAELRAGQENSAHVVVPARRRVLNDLQRTRPSCGRMIQLFARPSPLPSASCLSFSVFLCVACQAYWQDRAARKPGPL